MPNSLTKSIIFWGYEGDAMFNIAPGTFLTASAKALMPQAVPFIISSIRPTIKAFFVDKDDIGVFVCSKVYKLGIKTSLSKLDFLQM